MPHKICEHNKRQSRCRQCGGSEICIHNRQNYSCKDCKGASICQHNKQKYGCKDCKGKGICEHMREKIRCKDCKGTAICLHNKWKPQCIECKGSSICDHLKQRNTCKDCNYNAYLRHIISARIRDGLKSKKSKKSVEYLGCNIEEFKFHIESQFQEGMNWDNYGEWQIDHKIPIMYNKPTMEQVKERLHWTNTQPLWAKENMSKGNRYISE